MAPSGRDTVAPTGPSAKSPTMGTILPMKGKKRRSGTYSP